MRRRPVWPLLLSLLLSPSLLAAQPHLPWQLDKGRAQVTLRLLPVGGAGTVTATDGWCTWLQANGKLVGNYICVQGDGTKLTSDTFTTVGTPTINASEVVCPSGLDCSTVSSVRLDGASFYKTGSVATASGQNFTACSIARADNITSAPYLVSHWVTGSETFTQFIQPNETLTIKSGAGANTSTGNYVPYIGAWQVFCGTYHGVADGTSVGRGYVDGQLVSTYNNDAMGLMAGKTTPMAVGARSDNARQLTGNLRGAFYTETILSAADIAALGALAVGSPLTSIGGMVTVTRASSKSCTNSTGSLNVLPDNRLCLANSGIYSEPAVTNLAQRSDDFSHAAWTATSVTVTADNAFAPDGTKNADTLAGTANGGLVESTAAAISGTSGTASVYVATSAGTQAGALVLRDTTAGADVCSQTYTATTTWQRISCSGTTTSGHNHTVRVYPGGVAGTGTHLAWGAQQEANGFAARYVRTTSASAQSNGDDISIANPITSTRRFSFAATAVPNGSAWSTGTQGILSIGSTVANDNSANLYVANGIATCDVYQSTSVLRRVVSNAAISFASHHIGCAATCNLAGAGTLTLTVDGVAVAQTLSGAGSNCFSYRRPTVTIGAMSSGAVNNFNGRLSDICLGGSGACP